MSEEKYSGASQFEIKSRKNNDKWKSTWLYGAQSILNITVSDIAKKKPLGDDSFLPFHLQRGDCPDNENLQSQSGAKSGDKDLCRERATYRAISKHLTQKEKESPAPPNLAEINDPAHDKLERRSDNNSEMQNTVQKKGEKKTYQRPQHTPVASHQLW